MLNVPKSRIVGMMQLLSLTHCFTIFKQLQEHDMLEQETSIDCGVYLQLIVSCN